MARKKIREYDSKRLLKEHLKRLAGLDLQICSAQVIVYLICQCVYVAGYVKISSGFDGELFFLMIT